jgi:hypothetical protein
MAALVRSLLGFLVATAIVIAVLAVTVVPVVARPLVAAAVRDALPFGDQPVEIEVDVDPLGLLTGSVASVRVRGSGLEARGARIDRLDVTFGQISIFDRSFAAVHGGLEGVTLPLDGGASARLASVTLSGTSAQVDALASLDSASAAAIVRSALADQGIGVAKVSLVDSGIEVEIAGLTVSAPLAIDSGRLVVVPVGGLPRVVLIGPGESSGWHLTTVTVRPNEMRIEAALDPARVLAPPG